MTKSKTGCVDFVVHAAGHYACEIVDNVNSTTLTANYTCTARIRKAGSLPGR
ncbi:MAG: hypothetical protein QME41_04085 [Actinomycetota bacterium]|nr:hypothetical protein [Actinomycetota bacterium]